MLGTYALSAGYYDAYYLKALKVRTLIKGDFDRAFESVDALVAPDQPDGRVPVRRPPRRPGRDVPVGRLHAAGQRGGPARGCRCPAGCPRGCRWVSSSSVEPFDEPTLFRLGRAYEAITATADWRRLEPTDLARLDDPETSPPAHR